MLNADAVIGALVRHVRQHPHLKGCWLGAVRHAETQTATPTLTFTSGWSRNTPTPFACNSPTGWKNSTRWCVSTFFTAAGWWG